MRRTRRLASFAGLSFHPPPLPGFKMNQNWIWLALLVLVAGGSTMMDVVPAQATTAVAHVCMDYPLARTGAECTARSPQKIGPCGVAERGEVSVFEPGATIDVRLRETVNHPSHYRISFDTDGEYFPDPETVDDIDPTKENVLVDGIVDADEAEQTVQVTLPDVECEDCTLQLIQVMYDKGGNGFGGRTADGGNDDMYYTCADIALRRSVAIVPAQHQRSRKLPGAGIGVLLVAGVVFAANRSRRNSDS